jgi:hypothetical protein
MSKSSTMPEQNKSPVRTWLLFVPLVVPLLLGFVASVWVPVRVAIAHKAGSCAIEAFWTEQEGKRILSQFYPSIIKEVELLRQRSTECVASLHVYMTSWLLVVFGLALISSFVLFLIFGPFKAKKPKDLRTRLYETAGMIIISLLIIGILIFMANYSVFINFDGSNRRYSVDFRNGYLDPFDYWLHALGGFFVWMFLIWLLYAGISAAITLIKPENNID